MVTMKTDNPSCQADTLELSSTSVHPVTVAFQRLRWHLQTFGWMATLRKIVSWRRNGNAPVAAVLSNAECSHPHLKSSSPHNLRPLNLQPGELVEVKQDAEIVLTLDANRRSGGLYFMPGMSAFCGKQLRVYKRVSQIALENEGGIRKLNNTVLLHDALCDGRDLRCDRSCFYFWRESWLRRVSTDPSQHQDPDHQQV